jgi:hypothetical protein
MHMPNRKRAYPTKANEIIVRAMLVFVVQTGRLLVDLQAVNFASIDALPRAELQTAEGADNLGAAAQLKARPSSETVISVTMTSCRTSRCLGKVPRKSTK